MIGVLCGEAAFYFILFAITKSTLLASKLTVDPNQIRRLKILLSALFGSEMLALAVFGPMRGFVFDWNVIMGVLYLTLSVHNVIFLLTVWYLLPQLRARLLSAFADPSSDDVLSATHLKDLDNDDESSSSSPPSPVLLYFRFERTVVFCSLGKLAFTFVQVFLGIELFTLNPNEHSRDWLVFYINSDTVKVTWLDLVAPILRYVILAAALWYTSLSAHLSDDDVMSERGSFSASDDDGLNDDGPVFISQDEPSDLHALPDDGKTNNNLSSYMTNYTPSSSSTSIFARMVNAIVSTFQSSSSSSSSSAFRSFPHSHRHSHPPHHHGSSSQSRSSSSIRFSRSEVGHSVSASASMSMSISIPPVLSLQIPARRQLSPSAERRRFAGVSISQSIDELDVALLDASAPEHSMLSV